jgi:hypothetical protein
MDKSSLPIGTTYDIHLASDHIDRALEDALRELGFRRDAFIGGTTGVVHPCHYSAHPPTLSAFRELWNRAAKLLQTAGRRSFDGYAEAEVTPARFRRYYELKPFQAGHKLPFERLAYTECPIDRYKDLDVHCTVDLGSIDPHLRDIFENDLNLHFVDIARSSGNVVRVYTFQPLGLKQAPVLFWQLAEFLSKVGGFEGKIKLESTYAFARFPADAAVCPVVTHMPSPAVNARDKCGARISDRGSRSTSNKNPI